MTTLFNAVRQHAEINVEATGRPALPTLQNSMSQNERRRWRKRRLIRALRKPFLVGA
ncbi:MAG TPA: hypothetical protein PKV67_08955 [Hyphomonas sp.]|nr:hypothetical protein [Hyphomonas sp.]HRK68062.1 hypothetical protein [Hyphomonas sp.]